LLLIFAYAFAVRYKLRPLFAKKWDFFSQRLSAPYFLLLFVLLNFCVLMLVLKHNVAAEIIAVMGYYLLIIVVVLEFIGFAKKPHQADTL
jgi:hypothetical protein